MRAEVTFLSAQPSGGHVDDVVRKFGFVPDKIVRASELRIAKPSAAKSRQGHWTRRS